MQDVASSENIDKITQTGKDWAVTQHQMEAFFVDSASGLIKAYNIKVLQYFNISYLFECLL